VGRSNPQGFYVTRQGYRALTQIHDHPLSIGNGEVLEHRYVLYEKIGAGPHPCHWGCGALLTWGVDLHVDHLDSDRLNNDPANIVPSCNPCNVRRAIERTYRAGQAEMLERVRAAMGAAGISQRELSRRSGIDPANISRILNGRSDCTLQTCDRLLKAVGK